MSTPSKIDGVCLSDFTISDRPVRFDPAESWLQIVDHEPLVLGLDFPDQATLEISASDIAYQRHSSGTDDVLRHLLLDWALPLALMLRRTPALHAAAVRADGRSGATLLCGVSGAGKSTTSFVLSQRQHRKIADDISALTLIDGQVHVEPGLAHSKLMVDALDRFAVDFRALRPVVHKAEKFVVPSLEQALERQRVMEIVELVCQADAPLGLQELRGVEKIGVLDRHTAGTTVMGWLGLRGMHMAWLTQLAASVPVYRLTRPAGRDTTDELVRLLEAHWVTSAP